MTLPLWDCDNPLRRVRYAYVNYGLIAINIIVYAFFQSGPFFSKGFHDAFTEMFSLHPSQLFGHAALTSAWWSPKPITLLTYQFLHTNPIHLLANMLFLWVFGDNVEDALGPVRYLLFYIFCGIFSALVQSYFMGGDAVLLGASGSIAGVLGAYLVLYPHVKVWCLIFGAFAIKIEAGWALGFWGTVQMLYAFMDPSGHVGWWAHLSGFLVGMMLIIVIRPRAAVLLHPPLSAPETPAPAPPPPPVGTI